MPSRTPISRSIVRNLKKLWRAQSRITSFELQLKFSWLPLSHPTHLLPFVSFENLSQNPKNTSKTLKNTSKIPSYQSIFSPINPPLFPPPIPLPISHKQPLPLLLLSFTIFICGTHHWRPILKLSKVSYLYFFSVNRVTILIEEIMDYRFYDIKKL
jgi:hypothetical protein